MEFTIEKQYTIGISLYSDDLYPEDYEDGQENYYQLNEEQYKRFLEMKFESSDDMDEWFVENLDGESIEYAQEFIDGIAVLDSIVFDYYQQKYLEMSI